MGGCLGIHCGDVEKAGVAPRLNRVAEVVEAERETALTRLTAEPIIALPLCTTSSAPEDVLLFESRKGSRDICPYSLLQVMKTEGPLLSCHPRADTHCRGPPTTGHTTTTLHPFQHIDGPARKGLTQALSPVCP